MHRRGRGASLYPLAARGYARSMPRSIGGTSPGRGGQQPGGRLWPGRYAVPAACGPLAARLRGRGGRPERGVTVRIGSTAPVSAGNAWGGKNGCRLSRAAGSVFAQVTGIILDPADRIRFPLCPHRGPVVARTQSRRSDTADQHAPSPRLSSQLSRGRPNFGTQHPAIVSRRRRRHYCKSCNWALDTIEGGFNCWTKRIIQECRLGDGLLGLGRVPNRMKYPWLAPFRLAPLRVVPPRSAPPRSSLLRSVLLQIDHWLLCAYEVRILKELQHNFISTWVQDPQGGKCPHSRNLPYLPSWSRRSQMLI